MLASLVMPALIAAAAQAAAPAVSLSSDVRREVTVVADGREKTVFEAPKSVVPGDRLIFTTRYANSGTRRADNVVVLNPLPKGVAWIGDASDGAQVSVDGGRTFGALSALRVTIGGTSRPATPADATHLRWTLAAVQPGAAGQVRYRGTVR
ncbi:hypothetical protein COC42_12115 [Sphingomonas spermidinifaciens]|uniref:DUF11 domain-containing protein n=1 Tax=Sphingomonas spermidinifaciens TaxID=1141889 RepID=A0A2A4B294_9SPHN|nr:DUF11 domain-containing protein [Sphingomonas spermidinifaciens]PCD02200.1 hypothetical protein COC42_12115 [Sphingomonas spermidinifaciens]